MTMDDTELDRRLAGLQRETAVDEAVWNGIERRIRPRRRFPAGLAAAAAVVGIAIAIVPEPVAHRFTEVWLPPGVEHFPVVVK